MCETDRRRLLATGALAALGIGAGSRAFAATGALFVCPPCGCAMDGVLFRQAGACPACGMTLVAFDPAAAAPRHPGPPDFDACMRLHVEASQFSGAVLVARGEEVLFSKGYGLAQAEWQVPCSPAAKFRLGSLTKPFTATVILQLAAAGSFGLNDSICDHLQNCTPAWRAVTIAQLLNHTSGIPDYMTLQSFWKARPRNRAEMLATFSAKPLGFPPGSRFSYSNSGYYLLGLIIEKATGKPYEDALRERIFGPLGMADSGYDHSDPLIPRRAAGYRLGEKRERLNALYVDMEQPFADGGLYATTGDLLKFARGFTGSKLLSAASRALMETPGKGAYGFGWFVAPAPGRHAGREISHGGNINGFSAWLSRFPQEDVVLAVLSNLQDTDARQIALNLYAILHHDPYEAPGIPA